MVTARCREISAALFCWHSAFCLQSPLSRMFPQRSTPINIRFLFKALAVVAFVSSCSCSLFCLSAPATCTPAGFLMKTTPIAPAWGPIVCVFACVSSDIPNVIDRLLIVPPSLHAIEGLLFSPCATLPPALFCSTFSPIFGNLGAPSGDPGERIQRQFRR